MSAAAAVVVGLLVLAGVGSLVLVALLGDTYDQLSSEHRVGARRSPMS